MTDQHLLGGRYLLKERVGAGGMASVYRAQDQTLDRTVAVKIMLPQYAGDATFAARFKQEAKAAAGLSSPYIVGVYDWGKDGDTYYIVMEYLRGTDLKSGVRSHGALDPQKVAQIGSQICSALSVAHRHEIIHRDIKPQNIMVLADGNIKVMDFGIARAKNSHLTQDNNVLGTAHYVSPEQTRGQELDVTSDIYSLGVVMYECVTGKVPFDGDDAISVALKQVNELPTPPSQVNPRVDIQLERIILKCMEKDPAKRFQSADELREVLNAYIAGRVIDIAEPTRVIEPRAATTTIMGQQTQQIIRPSVADSTVQRKNIAPTSYYTDDNDEPAGMGKGKVVAAVIGVLAVIGIAIAIALSFMGGNAQVSIPNVMGMTEEKATEALEGVGLVASVEQQYSSEEDKGTVIEQTPKGGATANKGSKVTIVVSQGAEPVKSVKVPSLNGLTAEAADQALVAAGLKGRMIEEVNDEVEAGTVFWQGVDAGSKVDEGSEIEYKVAKQSEAVSVPGVLGKSFSEASNTLSEAGFEVVDGGSEYSNIYVAGQVMKQSVTGTARKGTAVELVVSKGPQDTSIDVDQIGLRGMSQADAESALAEAGLRYDSTRTHTSSTVPRGQVISYSPGGKQKQGTTIFLTISTGDE
ncbi:Stk1 family PASTA domain-containing Ser/Thr kinase [Collinsella sp. zg1085]|uniref:Stk1 family PASTA domain-containing Ser/Thr kinase n=1 Tax=Collinsella sp. zg1085 TaxID=2844380 RepID=UPI001C0B48AF|nr:Stk1 family PASTA domain-containing Ser/Thr kinase [Collinsella sp. zg1085]QWT17782.1 Stk1 family PASTA domain-containing Ser/Thr kinase [Collinsella sp. zg1085]